LKNSFDFIDKGFERSSKYYEKAKESCHETLFSRLFKFKVMFIVLTLKFKEIKCNKKKIISYSVRIAVVEEKRNDDDSLSLGGINGIILTDLC
jgi:hypothetical protein